jgi:two-component system, LytTR family, sensor kinase
MSKKYVLLLHLSFWILYALVPELPLIFPDRKYPEYYYYYSAASQVLNVFNFYTVYVLVSPDLLSSKRLWRNLMTVLGVLAFFVMLRLVVMILVDVYLGGFAYQEIKLRFYHVVVEAVNTITFTTMALLIRFMIDWFNAQKQKTDLQAKSRASELALLRSQINPHFLFNTLNNIYSLVYKKSDEAPSVVMKLSEIMRYMLYDANSEKVMLTKEIDYLKSFIELNELRLKEGKISTFTINGNYSTQLIPPMLLIPFVENAFKHGSKKGGNPAILIRLDMIDKGLEFDVVNNVEPGLSVNKDQVGGIGMENVRKRLDMLYPGKHDLRVDDLPGSYHVNLKIFAL